MKQRHRGGAKGATLLEVLMSLALLLVGVLGLFKTLTTSIGGTRFASQLGQAQIRASAIIEAIRNAPSTSLTCLVSNPATSWSTCETDCISQQTGSGTTKAQSCIFTTASFVNIPGPLAAGNSDERADRGGQLYGIVYSNTNPLPYRTSFVRQTGSGNRVYDIQITVGWNSDDGTANNPNHFVTLRSAVFN